MDQIPRHVAIVMDGNGRWARDRGLPRVAGHRAGVKVLQEIVAHCARAGIKVLSLFAFSCENRSRPKAEVGFLMTLMRHSLQKDVAKIHENNIRLKVVGDRQYYDKKLLWEIERAEALTAENTGMTLVIAIHYSGRWDIVQATQKLLANHAQGNSFDAVKKSLQEHLAFCEFPDPDLLIRSSGEQRVSNFMLWQLAYSEIYFTDTRWPDFNSFELERAFNFYQMRQRRFGLTPEQVEAEQYA